MSATFENALAEPAGLRVNDGSRYVAVPEAAPIDTRRLVDVINAVVSGIAVRAIIFQQGPGMYEFEVRVDGYPTPDSPFRGFVTEATAIQSAKVALYRWIGEVLERL